MADKKLENELVEQIRPVIEMLLEGVASSLSKGEYVDYHGRAWVTARQLVTDLKLCQEDDDQRIPLYKFEVQGWPVSVDVEMIAKQTGFRRIRRQE